MLVKTERGRKVTGGGGGSSPWEDNPELDGGIKYEDGDLLVGESMAGGGSKMFFNATKVRLGRGM